MSNRISQFVALSIPGILLTSIGLFLVGSWFLIFIGGVFIGMALSFSIPGGGNNGR